MTIIRTSQASKPQTSKPNVMSPATQAKAATIVTSKDVKRGPGRPPSKPQAPIAAMPSKPTVPQAAIAAPMAQASKPNNNATNEGMTLLREINKTVLALNARVEQLEAKIAGLASKAQKAQAPTRTEEELLSGIAVPSNDWRLPYQGVRVRLFMHETDRKGDILVHDDKPPVEYFLCVPRDNDLGGEGSAARASGRIAAYWNTNEAGEFAGQPAYYTIEELTALWAD